MPFGWRMFVKETRIKDGDRIGKYWARWSDGLRIAPPTRVAEPAKHVRSVLFAGKASSRGASRSAHGRVARQNHLFSFRAKRSVNRTTCTISFIILFGQCSKVLLTRSYFLLYQSLAQLSCQSAGGRLDK